MYATGSSTTSSVTEASPRLPGPGSRRAGDLPGEQPADRVDDTVTSRRDSGRLEAFGFPVIPRMIAGMALVDGIVLAVAVEPLWILAGMTGAVLTHLGQRYVRGD